MTKKSLQVKWVSVYGNKLITEFELARFCCTCMKYILGCFARKSWVLNILAVKTKFKHWYTVLLRKGEVFEDRIIFFFRVLREQGRLQASCVWLEPSSGPPSKMPCSNWMHLMTGTIILILLLRTSFTNVTDKDEANNRQQSAYTTCTCKVITELTGILMNALPTVLTTYQWLTLESWFNLEQTWLN